MISYNKIKSIFNSNGLRLVFILALSSCLTPIDFSTENIGGTFVVSGQISSFEDQNMIQLGLTAATDQLPLPVSGATVQLMVDNGDSFEYLEDQARPGIYLLPGIGGIPGRSYYVRITVPGGRVYESTPEKMPSSTGSVTVSYEVVKEDFTDPEGIITPENFLKLYANAIFPVNEETNYIRWRTEETFLLSPTDFPDPFGQIPPSCFVVQNADPQRITLFNGETVKTSTVENLLVASKLIDWTFLEKHAFTTYQSALTKDAYEYWRKVNILSNQVGSIFDTPPAEITGNIRNVNNPNEKVLGYFQACNEVYDRIFIYPFNLPFPLLFSNCTYDGNRATYPGRCLDCLTARNSSYYRPEWF